MDQLIEDGFPIFCDKIKTDELFNTGLIREKITSNYLLRQHDLAKVTIENLNSIGYVNEKIILNYI